MLKTIVCLSCLGLGAGLDYSMTAKTHGADYGFVTHIRARADSVQASFAEMKSYLTPPPMVMPVEPAPTAVAVVVKPRVVPVVAPVRDVTVASAAPVATPVWQPAVSAATAIQPDQPISAAQPEVVAQPEVLVIATAAASDDMGLEGLTEAPSEGLADDEATIAELGATKEVSALQQKASAKL